MLDYLFLAAATNRRGATGASSNHITGRLSFVLNGERRRSPVKVLASPSGVRAEEASRGPVPPEDGGALRMCPLHCKPGEGWFMPRPPGAAGAPPCWSVISPQYADPVADLLDQWGVFRSRLFRESCVFHRGNYVKDLSRLGRELSKVIIIDNSPASYIFHPENAVSPQVASQGRPVRGRLSDDAEWWSGRNTEATLESENMTFQQHWFLTTTQTIATLLQWFAWSKLLLILCGMKIRNQIWKVSAFIQYMILESMFLVSILALWFDSVSMFI